MGSHWVDRDADGYALQLKLTLAHSVMGIKKHECTRTVRLSLCLFSRVLPFWFAYVCLDLSCVEHFLWIFSHDHLIRFLLDGVVVHYGSKCL